MAEVIKVPGPDNPDLPRGGPGKKRMVPLIPTPYGHRPAIWISDYTFIDDGKACHNAVVLIDEGSGDGQMMPPQVGSIRIHRELLDKLPQVPIEW